MRRLESKDMLKHVYLGNPLCSSDGQYVLFSKEKASQDMKGYDLVLCCYSTAKKEVIQLDLDFRINGYISDGYGGFYISSVSDHKTSIYHTNPQTASTEKKYEFDQAINLVHALENKLIVSSEHSCKPDQRENTEYYEILDEIPFWYNGIGFVSGSRTGLCIADCTTGKITPISPDTFHLTSSALSADAKKIYYVGMTYTDVLPLTHEVRVYDIENNSDTLLLPGGNLRISNIGIAAGTLFITATDLKKYGVHENPEFYKLHHDGSYEKLTDFDTELGNMSMSDCNFKGGCQFIAADDKIYFIATERYGSVLYMLDCSKNTPMPKQVLSVTGNIESIAAAEGSLFAVCLKDYSLHELYQIISGKAVKISNFNAEAMNSRNVHIPDKITFMSGFGIETDGFILKPENISADRKYPMILNIHGGPKAIYGETYYYENQYWADNGYFVIYCNPFGSTGRGNEFADMRGKYGTTDYDDIMKFVETVLEKYPQIDRDSLFVTGGSYGGFMTNWIIGHTDMFAAAATQRSISNWLSDFNMSDISFQEAEFDHLATPWSNPKYLWHISPIKYADRITTPLLILHSDIDFHCTSADAFQMLTALKYHGVESKMVLFHGEDHSLSRLGKPINRIKRLDEITDWFEKHKKYCVEKK